jgi:hypothetical protein
MNLITETWRGLIRRKLWPVALLLVGALVAVPVLLAKEPEVTAPPASVTASAADEGLPVTYVTSAAEAEAASEETGKRRRTLGAEKDPFEPAPLPKPKKTKKKAKAKAAETEKTTSAATPDPEPDRSSSGGGGASVPAPSAPVATATPVATPKPPRTDSVKVRFTRVADEGAAEPGEAQTVEKLEVLPDEKHPVLAFRGLKQGGKVAVFELTGNVTVEGDGTCEPTPEECQSLELRAGETQFITVTDTGEETDAQYQLDLVKIIAKK